MTEAPDTATRRPLRLGERLVQEGRLSKNQLETALGEQKRTGAALGEVLVSMGFLSESELCQQLASERGVPFVDLDDLQPDPALLADVSPDFALKHGIFPVRRDGDVVVVAFARPTDILALDAVKQRLWRQFRVAAAAPRDVRKAIHRYLDTAEGAARDGEESLLPEDASALTERILDQGLRRMATDIHIEPEENLVRMRYRVDGMLEQGDNLPVEAGPGIITRIKILSGLDITERRRPQDGRFSMKRNGRDVDLRVSIMPTRHGENAVLRVLDKAAVSLDLDDMGISGTGRAAIDRILAKPFGMLLVSGPTGSGKSTTLYALLLSLDSLTRKIITIEDPIEYEQPLIRQSQVEPSIGFTFASGLRTALRQDPDVILVGEIRDGETADVALKASLTGHMLLSSIHTNSAAGVVTRLVDLGVDRHLVASSFTGAVAQRLARRVCQRCREQRPATVSEAATLKLPAEGLLVWEGRGCDACRGTGYSGRLAVFEVFEFDNTCARLLVEGASEDDLHRHAKEHGMQTMEDDAREKVLAGKTTVAELLRVCSVEGGH